MRSLNIEEYNQYYLKYKDEFYRYLFKNKYAYYISTEEVNNILNYSFNIIYHKYDKNLGISNFLGYLKRTGYNVMRNNYKYNKRYYDKNIELNNEVHYNVSNKKSILDLLVEKEFKEIIKTFINKLDEINKKVIKLKYFYDYTMKEISRILNISYSKIKKMIKNSLEILKEEITNSNYDMSEYINYN